MRLQDEANADDSAVAEKPEEPTSYTLLDVKKMKVAELKAELQARNLPTDGKFMIII